MNTPALGALPAHLADHPHRRVKLASFLAPDLPEPPPVVDWTGPVSGWGEYGNATRGIGNCTCVAPANVIRLWTAHRGEQVDLPEEAVLAAYRTISDYDPDDITTDTGAIVSDALALWHARGPGGIGGDILDGFAEVEHEDSLAIRRCIATFGACILRVDLPLAARGRMTWIDVPRVPGDVTPPSLYVGAAGLTDEWTPGSWGLHCVPAVMADLDGVGVVTWGNLIRVSWRWLATYCGEAWAPVSKDWLTRDGKSPSGLDLDGLLAARDMLRDHT